MTTGEGPEYLSLKRAAWTKKNAEYTDGRARRAWDEPEITWGVWAIPESTVGVLPDLAGKDPATIAVSIAADLLRIVSRDRAGSEVPS